MELPKTQEVFSEGQLGYRGDTVNPNAFGASVAKSLDVAANDLNEIAQKRQAIYNENVLNDSLAGYENNIGDIRKDYTSKQGLNALNAYDDSKKKLNDLFNDTRAKLNPAVQRQFDYIGHRILRGTLDSMDSHWDQQLKAYTVDSTKALLDSGNKQAALNYNNPTTVEQYRRRNDEAVERLGQKMGWSADEVQQHKDASTGMLVHDSVMAALSDKDTKTAEGIMATYKDAVDPKVYREMESQVRSTKEAAYVDEEHAYTQLERKRKEADRATFNAFLPKLVDGSANASDVLRSGAQPELKYRMLEMIKAADREDSADNRKSDPAVVRNLMYGIQAGKLPDESEITDSFIGGKINKADMVFLQQEWEHSKTPEGNTLNTARHLFNQTYEKMLNFPSDDVSGGKVIDPQAGSSWYAYNSVIDQKIAEYRKDGKNPVDLFNPSNKDFVGNLLPTFQRTTDQIFGAARQDTVTAAQQGQPTPAALAYLKAHPETLDKFKKTYPGYKLPQDNRAPSGIPNG